MSNKLTTAVTIMLAIMFVQCQLETAEPSIPSQREYSVQSVLWQQNAAEFRALSYQSYALARMQLDRILADKQYGGKKLAIVADLDETVIDNSRYNAMLIEKDIQYSKSTWTEWGEKISADSIPGCVAFFNYAAARGVEAFYISNRNDTQLDVTIANLKKLGLPFADSDHVLLRTETSGKEPRRMTVARDHSIVLLLGDNLSDFSDVFDGQGTLRRNFLVDSLRNEFGSRFIVFANPMYGDWESKGIYEGKYDWTPAQADSIRKSKIRAY